jgi:hypothetical protein
MTVRLAPNTEPLRSVHLHNPVPAGYISQKMSLFTLRIMKKVNTLHTTGNAELLIYKADDTYNYY